MPSCGPAISCSETLGTRPTARLHMLVSWPLGMPPWCLTCLLTGALLTVSHPTQAQPDALLVFPGQMAQLSCKLIPKHTPIRDFTVSWYQQRAGSAPRYLLYYRSEEDHHRAPGIPDRFSAAKDEAHNACILTINPVQPEDDADYYCSVGYKF